MFFSNTILLITSIFFLLTLSSLAKPLPVIWGDPFTNVDTCIANCDDEPDPHQCKLNCVYGGHPPHQATLGKGDVILSSGGRRPDDGAGYCMLQCMQNLADMAMCERRCYGKPPHHSKVDDISKRDTIPLEGSEKGGRRDAADYCMVRCTESLVDLTTCEHRCYNPRSHNIDGIDDISKHDTVGSSPHIDACISGCHDKPHPQQCREHCRTGGIPPDDGGVPTMDRRSVLSLPSGSEEKRQDGAEYCMLQCMETLGDSEVCRHRCHGVAPAHSDDLSSISKRDAVRSGPRSQFNACISSCDGKPHSQQCRSHCITDGVPPDDGVLPPLRKRSVISHLRNSEEKRQSDPAKCMVECMQAPSDAPMCLHRCYGSPPHHNKKISTISKRNTVPSKLNANDDQCTVKCSDDAPRPYHCKLHCSSTGDIPSDDGVVPPLHKRSVISPPSGSEEQACMDDCMQFPWDSQICEQRCFGSPAKHSDEWSSIGKRDVEEHPRYPQPYSANYRQCVNYCEYWEGLSSRDCIQRCRPPSTQQRGTVVKRDQISDIDAEKIDISLYQQCLDSCTASGHSLKWCMATKCPWAKRSTAEGFDIDGPSADVSFHRHSERSFARGHTKRDRNSNIDGEKIDVSPYQHCLDVCTETGHSLKYCTLTKCPLAKRSTAEELDGSAADFSFHGHSVTGGHTKRDVRSHDSDDSKACAAKCSRGPPAVREFCEQYCLTHWTGGFSFPDQNDRIKMHSESTAHLKRFSNGDYQHVRREVEGVKHAKRDSEDDCANKCALAVNYEECLQNCLW